MPNIITPSISIFADSVRKSKLKLKASSKLIFICGAKPNEGYPTARDLIKKYADKHLNSFQFYMAEEFFSAFDNERSLNLLTLEENLCKYSDCIMIILEGESAFAELGAFALDKELVRQILIINEREYRNSTSFIARGPIAKVNSESKFTPSIHIDFNKILECTLDIENSLDKIKRFKVQDVDMRNLSEFTKCNPKHHLLFLSDIISIFGPIKRYEIYEILRKIYNQNEDDKKFIDLVSREELDKIDFELALLEALKFIKKKSTYYYPKSNSNWMFYKYVEIRPESLRANVIVKYNKKDKKRIDILVY